MSPPPDVSVSGVVLAGGRSSRFGRDKLAEGYRGIPLLYHAVVRLSEVCHEVIVVLAPDEDEPLMPSGTHVRFAHDEIGGEGPLAGVVAGLSAAVTQWVVLAGGDMPDLQPAVLGEMLRAAHETGAVAIALADGGEARPLPCVLTPRPAAEAARELLGTGGRRLKDLLAAVPLVVVDEPTWTELDPGKRTLFDVDEPADLDR